MGIILAWLFFSIVVGALGSGRSVGFFGAFLASIILSPLVGILIVAFSDKTLTKEQKEAARLDQLDKLLRLKQGGAISEEEYEAKRAKLMGTVPKVQATVPRPDDRNFQTTK